MSEAHRPGLAGATQPAVRWADPVPPPPPSIGVPRGLDRLFTLLRSHFWVIYGITIVIQIPVFFYNLLVRQFQVSMLQGSSQLFMKPEMLLTFYLGMFLFLMIWSLVWPLGTMAVTSCISRGYLGRPTTVWGSYRDILRLFLPGLVLFIIWIMLITIGSLLCIVPGIYLAVRFYVVFPAFVVERRGIFDALSRSWEITRGNFWRIFLLTTIVGLVKAALATSISYSGAVIFSGAGLVPVLFHSLFQLLGQLVAAPLDWMLAVVIYFGLREVREGLDLEILSGELAHKLLPRAPAQPAVP